MRSTSFLGIRARTAGLKDFQLPDACLRADVRFDKLKFEQKMAARSIQKPESWTYRLSCWFKDFKVPNLANQHSADSASRSDLCACRLIRPCCVI